jgi:diketogulonate reductase-like aldo/keto reductase
MKSERVVGCALQYLIKQKNIPRNELFISSKGGFLHEDMDNQIHLPQVLEEFLSHPESRIGFGVIKRGNV